MAYQFTKAIFRRASMQVEADIDGMSDVIDILNQESSTLAMLGEDMEVVLTNMKASGGASISASVDGEPAKRTRKSKETPVAVAPAPLPVPSTATATVTTLPPNALPAAAASEPDIAIPPALRRDPATNTAPAVAAPTPPLPTASAPPLAPLPPASPPPVGLLGPKVVKALDDYKKIKEDSGVNDGGQALADWLAESKLTIKGATYDEACRAVLMISDEKLKGVADALKVA